MIKKIKKLGAKISRKRLILVIGITVFCGLLGFFIYTREFSVLPDASVSLMRDAVNPTSADKVLIISPHPDDETIAAGGYIERAKKNDAKLEILLVTDGNRRGHGAERHQEFIDATKILGAEESDLKFLNLPEFYLKEKVSQGDLTKILSNEITSFSPTIIIYPEEVDANPDHKYIGSTVNGILKNVKVANSYKYLVHWDYFPRPIGLHENYNLTPPAKLVNFQKIWQRFMLTPAEENTKLAAVLSYKSQLKTPLLNKLLFSMVRKNELFDNSN